MITKTKKHISINTQIYQKLRKMAFNEEISLSEAIEKIVIEYFNK